SVTGTCSADSSSSRSSPAPRRDAHHLSRRAWVGGFAVALIALIAVTAALWSRAGAASPSATPREGTQSREVLHGRQLYATHCVVCHGETGKGDGPSAGGFATKPSDLADGRLMNGLPDAFIVNIILHGGPAEGLTPGMPPFKAYLGEAQARDIAAYVRTLAQAALDRATAKELVPVAGAPRQPILFSHLIHAGSFKIDCQYCHADARRSEHAGLPSAQRCLARHQDISAQH